MKPLYFDYCATTPLHPQVKQRMDEVFNEVFGNPSSMHLVGQQARQLVETARQQTADAIGAQPEEITFTGSATESDNLALVGVMRALQPHKRHLITSTIEHHAILHTAQAMEAEGYAVTYLPVDGQGLVDPEEVRRSIRPDTGLISVMLVNNEVGTIEPIQEIGQVAHEHGIIFHSDAVQALGCLDVDVDDLCVDLISISAHKIYGPKGIGALYVRQGTPIRPMIYGGSQERKLRPGTENVAGIVGLGAALELVGREKEQARERLWELRDFLIGSLEDIIPDLIVNGPEKQISPHVVSLSFPGVDGEMMLFHLSQQGIAVSMGSACTSEDIEPSHVLSAMGLPLEQIDGTLRVSLGYDTTQEEVQLLLEKLPQVVADSVG